MTGDRGGSDAIARGVRKSTERYAARYNANDAGSALSAYDDGSEASLADMKANIDSAAAIVRFWTEAGPGRWFKKDVAFDDEFRAKFAAEHDAATSGSLDDWATTVQGALALMILLDQYPRNSFRGTSRMFATDGLALDMAKQAIARGFDRDVDPALRRFFYLPFMHAESLPEQDRSLLLHAPLGEESMRYAVMHRDIIARFGRFPHRNTLVGRRTSAEEQSFLDGGGFSG